VTFQQELTALLNSHSQENGSDTPDCILATYLLACLQEFNDAVTERTGWYTDVRENKRLREERDRLAERVERELVAVAKWAREQNAGNAFAAQVAMWAESKREALVLVEEERRRRKWWRKRQTVIRRCWYCARLFAFPKWPGLHDEVVINEWYCPECGTRG
jgi:hypothetical protein